MIADVFGLSADGLATSISIDNHARDLEVKIKSDSFRFDKVKHINEWIDLVNKKGYVEVVILNLVPVAESEANKLEVLSENYRITSMDKCQMPLVRI